MLQSSVDMDKKIEKQQQVYKRLKLLGTGAYGKAYLVKEIKTDQSYVIKQIIIADMSQQEQQNALRQAKILEALSHPNIIKFKEVYRTSKMRLNIVMEYADEGDLATKIKQAKKQSRYFEETQILDWFTQICLGIKHIHDRKIIHRDLKAQNIFLTSDKIIKIGDFGVSRVLQKTAMNAKTVVGSPYYLSPQIIENKPYSFQTDIWSLGALLYQMCALSPPFVANNLQFLALKIVKGAYGQIPNHYSYDLRSLIKSMLNTDSSKRPTINKILTSKVISKRISNFLTESKRIDQFSHTVIHNKNIFESNLGKTLKHQQKALLPPPNLINIEKEIENKSQICLSNVNFEVQNEVKHRPFTPVVGQQRKGPNNFFNNNNKKSLKKNLVEERSSNKDKNNLNLIGLIQIKPSALEEKIKLPKVNTNPTIFDRKQSEAYLQKNKSGLDNLNNVEKAVPVSAFSKKRVQSKQVSSNSPVINAKQRIQKEENKEQQKDQNTVGKWKKPPKNLEKIETIAQRFQVDQQKHYHNQIDLCLQQQNQTHSSEAKHQQKQIEKKQPYILKNNRSQSKKKILNPMKKNSLNTNKKQVAVEKEKKTPIVPPKKSSTIESVNETAQTFELVSEQMKKKAAEEKDKIKKRSTSKSKIEKDGKKIIANKNVHSELNKNRVSQTKKIPKPKTIKIGTPSKPQTQTKPPKKSDSKTILQKLARPPRLEFGNHHEEEFQSPQKQQTLVEEQEIVEEQKCNSDRSQQKATEEMYSYEEFQQYQNEENESGLTPKEEQQINNESLSEQDEERLSLNLSDSCKHIPNHKNQNFNKMLNQMENIKNMIAMANGVIDTLPVFGTDFNQKNLLQLSEPSQEVIRQDDSELDSIINDQIKIDCIQQINSSDPANNSKIEENLQINSNSSGSFHSHTNTNLTLLSNQEHLQTLKMNLEQLFGEQNIIFIHEFLCEVIEQEGLDFSQKDVQRMIIFQKPDIDSLLLKKYFRLIVTVVIMEQQQNTVYS